MTAPKKPAHLHPSDLHALTRLATDAATGLVDIVESVHTAIAPPAQTGRTGEITTRAYRAVREVTRLVGQSAEVTLAQVGEVLGRREDTPQRRAMLAVLNGLWGDYLAATDSPLALPMSFDYGEVNDNGRLVVLVHGLCLNGRGWTRATAAGANGPTVHDHGAALARDLGYSPVYLTYNSGLHISANGRALAMMLQALIDAWPRPVEELTLIGHSMGGLVIRSAAHYAARAGDSWPQRLRALIFLGTPHHGAPLEQRGNLLNVLMDASPYVAPFGRLGKRRSAGITDLRYSNLVDEDWFGRDRFAHGPCDTCIVPLPAGARAYAVAATLGGRTDSLRARLLGDGLVPLDSALGRHTDPSRALPFDESNSWVGYGMSHMDLLGRVEVYERIAGWLGEVSG